MKRKLHCLTLFAALLAALGSLFGTPAGNALAGPDQPALQPEARHSLQAEMLLRGSLWNSWMSRSPWRMALPVCTRWRQLPVCRQATTTTSSYL